MNQIWKCASALQTVMDDFLLMHICTASVWASKRLNIYANFVQITHTHTHAYSMTIPCKSYHFFTKILIKSTNEQSDIHKRRVFSSLNSDDLLFCYYWTEWKEKEEEMRSKNKFIYFKPLISICTFQISGSKILVNVSRHFIYTCGCHASQEHFFACSVFFACHFIDTK